MINKLDFKSSSKVKVGLLVALILTNLIWGYQAYDQFEKLKDIDHYGSTEIDIQWKDNEGTLHKDLVKLSIVKTISLGK